MFLCTKHAHGNYEVLWRGHSDREHKKKVWFIKGNCFVDDKVTNFITNFSEIIEINEKSTSSGDAPATFRQFLYDVKKQSHHQETWLGNCSWASSSICLYRKDAIVQLNDW